ncbi:MAG: acyltransferase family protein [Paracoccaceae bacterium]
MFKFTQKMSQRSELLDCIRAVAVTMVVIFHVVAAGFYDTSADTVAGLFQRYGFLGVDIFFPLSGFLITSFLLKYSDNQAIKTFFLRRFFRIVPLYALALIVFIVAALVTGIDANLLDRTWINATFLTGWYIFLEGRETVPYTITWSLSVEEFAYILFGIAAWLIRRNFVALLWAITLLSIGLRFWLNLQDAVDVYYFPPARLDSIAIGGLLAAALHYGKRPLPWLAGGLVLAILLSQFGDELRQTMLFLKLTLATCMVILAIQTWAPEFRSRPTFPFAVIGFYSYFIYLFHYFFIYALEIGLSVTGIEMGFWVFCLVVVAATTFAGHVSYVLFEGPLMKFGRGLEPERSNKMHTVETETQTVSRHMAE